MKYVENIHVQNTIRSSLKHPGKQEKLDRSETVLQKARLITEEAIYTVAIKMIQHPVQIRFTVKMYRVSAVCNEQIK